MERLLDDYPQDTHFSVYAHGVPEDYAGTVRSIAKNWSLERSMGFYVDLATIAIVIVLAVPFTLALKAVRLAIWCIKAVVGHCADSRATKYSAT